MHDRAQLREQHAGGRSIRGIARTGPSRNAVRRAIAPGARDRYYRPSATEAAEQAVRDVLADYPHMATVDIAVLIDWRRSRQTLSDLVVRLRPQYLTEERDVGCLSITAIRTGRLTDIGQLRVGSLKL